MRLAPPQLQFALRFAAVVQTELRVVGSRNLRRASLHVGHVHVPTDLVKEPLEGLALQLRAQLLPRPQISQVLPRHGPKLVEVPHVVVHPHLRDPRIVPVQDGTDVHAAQLGIDAETVELPVYVADVGARADLHGAATSPNPEGHLDVLGTVEMNFRVVHACFEEVLAVHRKQASGHHRCFDRRARFVDVVLDDVVGGVGRENGERQPPSEGASQRGPCAATLDRHRLDVDRDDVRHDDPGPVAVYPTEERLQPSMGHFGVRVQDDNDRVKGLLHATVPRTYNSIMNITADKAYLARWQLALQPLEVLPEVLQFRQVAVVVNYQHLSEELWGRSIQYSDDVPQQSRQGLVVKYNNDRGLRQLVLRWPLSRLASSVAVVRHCAQQRNMVG
mmetsp:Transcript_3849/g.14307  ORF Transcript_3849/g.14307 Transcript_3849/m.14307 type:complete len:389 (-) Transcript_3849:531-1697(-)